MVSARWNGYVYNIRGWPSKYLPSLFKAASDVSVGALMNRHTSLAANWISIRSCAKWFALAANALRITVNGVQGQPALLYLVPCTLGAVWWRALRRAAL